MLKKLLEATPIPQTSTDVAHHQKLNSAVEIIEKVVTSIAERKEGADFSKYAVDRVDKASACGTVNSGLTARRFKSVILKSV